MPSLESMGLPLREGDILADKYRIESPLGVGGMGVVLAARHLTLGQRVAIKLMLPETIGGEGARERFVREARAAALLTSEHAVHVHDIGELPDGPLYMVMELLEGIDLGSLIESCGQVPPEMAAAYVLQACEALQEAHARGIIHRDLKPSNLCLTRQRNGTPLVKVLDFGISKIIGATADGGVMTRTSDVMGSPSYMAPEQIRDARAVDARTDVWGLGVILFELMTAHPPFDGTSLPQLCACILEHPVPPMSTFRKDIPPGLVEVVQRCMRKLPGERFATMHELSVALAPFVPKDLRIPSGDAAREACWPASSHAANGLWRGASGRPPSCEQTLDPLGISHPGQRAPRRAWWKGAVVMILALMGVGIGIVLGRSGPQQPAVPPEAGAPDPKHGSVSAVAPTTTLPLQVAAASAAPPHPAHTAIASTRPSRPPPPVIVPKSKPRKPSASPAPPPVTTSSPLRADEFPSSRK